MKAALIDYPRNDKYRRDYLEALEPYEKNRWMVCVEVAKYNLSDPTLPRYFQIKNRILCVLAEHDWEVAERFRVEAERIYEETVFLTKPHEKAEQRTLAAFRVELDELRETHGEDPALFQGVTGEMESLEIEGEGSLVGEWESNSEAVADEHDAAESKLDEQASSNEDGNLEIKLGEKAAVGQ